jgi:hypothetical protein
LIRNFRNIISVLYVITNTLHEEEFEDTKGVIKICKSKGQTTQWLKEKGQQV